MTMTSRCSCPVSLGWALLLAGCGPAQAPTNLHSADLPSDAPPSNQENACNAGNVKSCSDLGHRFEEGRGVPKDEARAAALYTKACDAGDALACVFLGLLFEDGRGVGKDPARVLAL